MRRRLWRACLIALLVQIESGQLGVELLRVVQIDALALLIRVATTAAYQIEHAAKQTTWRRRRHALFGLGCHGNRWFDGGGRLRQRFQFGSYCRAILSLGQLAPAPAPLVGYFARDRLPLRFGHVHVGAVELRVGLGRGRPRNCGRCELGRDLAIA